jgi:CheY-like chemotaxis protein
LHRLAPEAAMNRKKILVVDDSSTVLFVEKMILSNGEYEVVTARDGQEGLEKAVAERPDLILMDVVMPRMDGYEACRQLRSREDTKGIPVVLVTTRDELQRAERADACGWKDCLAKPVNALDLLATVKRCLGR